MKKQGKDKVSLATARRSDITKVNSGRTDEKKERKIGFDFSYLFSALLTIAVAAASVGLVLYFGYHTVKTFTTDVTTTPAYDVTENEYRRGVGYIVRSETPVRTKSSGTPDYAVVDGERIGVGELICRLYSSLTDDVRGRIAEIDREIALLESIVGTGVIETGLPEALRDANAGYAEIMLLLSEGKYADAAAISDSFLSAIGRIDALENGSGDIKNQISMLYAERSGLVAAYGKKTGSVNADSVGYFFRDCDGYEAIFDPALLKNITFGEFAELTVQEPADTAGCVGKMLDNPKWYLCLPFDAEKARGFESGRDYNITFNDNGGKVLTMYLERLVLDLNDHDDDGDRAEALLIFSTSEMPKGFVYRRTQDVSIEYASYHGYRIPLSSVRYYDGMTGVYTLGGGYVLFRQIKVIFEGDGYCIAADYSDAEPGKPLTYTSLGFPDHGKIDDYASLHSFAEELGLEKTVYDNGGIPVPKGRTLRYFYHLNDLEQIILTGKDLYHGKALD